MYAQGFGVPLQPSASQPHPCCEAQSTCPEISEHPAATPWHKLIEGLQRHPIWKVHALSVAR